MAAVSAWPDLSRRSEDEELMDTATVSLAEFESCLRDLAFLNRLTLAYYPTERWVGRALNHAGGRRLRLLDVGCGYGDMLRRLRDRFGAERMELVGVDLNPLAAEAARRAGGSEGIRYETADVFAFDERFDLVISAIFTHHLKDPALVRFLRWMEERAASGWLINDLRRHIVPWAFTRWFSVLMRLDPMTAHDGPVSVSRAFVRADWDRLLAEAGFRPGDVEVARVFPFRWTVGRLK
jgi:SAM-dependent methyltransferase